MKLFGCKHKWITLKVLKFETNIMTYHIRVSVQRCSTCNNWRALDEKINNKENN